MSSPGWTPLSPDHAAARRGARVIDVSAGSLASRSGALRVGDVLLSVNGDAVTGGPPHAMALLEAAEGHLSLVLGRQAAAAPPVAQQRVDPKAMALIAEAMMAAPPAASASCGVPPPRFELQRGDTLSALFTLGCPMPAFVLAAAEPDDGAGGDEGHSGGGGGGGGGEGGGADGGGGGGGGGEAIKRPSTMERLQSLSLRVPSTPFWRCEALRPIREGAPRSVLRWTNYWHPSDPLAYPCASWLGGEGSVDVTVKLSDKAGEVEPLDYIGQVGSREILSPIAYTLTQLWLHANPHIEADTAQLEGLALHGSGTRAALMKRRKAAAEQTRVGARKAAAMAKQRAAVMLDKAAAARAPGKRDGARGRASSVVPPSAAGTVGAHDPFPQGAGGAAGRRGRLTPTDDDSLTSSASTPGGERGGDPFPQLAGAGVSHGHAAGGPESSRAQGGGGGGGASMGTRALQALRKVEAKVESRARDAAQRVAASERIGHAKGMFKSRFGRGGRPGAE